VAHTVCCGLLSIALAGGAIAYDPSPAPGAVAEALAIGQSRVDTARAQFHRPYRLPVNEPPVDYLEVVTPFRRVVLLAETRARAGDRLFGRREALLAAAERGAPLEIVAELTFHPLNTYLDVPAFEVELAGPAPGVAPIQPHGIVRSARYGARVDGLPVPYPLPPAAPRGSEPMLGATVVAEFEREALDPDGLYEVVIRGAERTVRVRLDLAPLR
jgi:hypothetical protein